MKSDFIERVKALDLPEGHYMVCGSAIMDLLGLRKADDIDLLVSPELFTELETVRGWMRNQKYPMNVDTPDHSAGAKQSLDFTKENYTLTDLLPKAALYEGIPVMDLELLREAKVQLGREKDIRDIQIIDEYLAR